MTTQSSINGLDIPNIRIVSTKLIHEQDLLVEVESTLTTIACTQCGRMISDFVGYDPPRRLRYLSPEGRPLLISLRPKRFRCPYCDDHPITIQYLQIHQPLTRSVGDSEHPERSE
jgi:transposase